MRDRSEIIREVFIIVFSLVLGALTALLVDSLVLDTSWMTRVLTGALASLHWLIKIVKFIK